MFRLVIFISSPRQCPCQNTNLTCFLVFHHVKAYIMKLMQNQAMKFSNMDMEPLNLLEKKHVERVITSIYVDTSSTAQGGGGSF